MPGPLGPSRGGLVQPRAFLGPPHAHLQVNGHIPPSPDELTVSIKLRHGSVSERLLQLLSVCQLSQGRQDQDSFLRQ